jgi:hypothetical protein
MSQPLYWCFIVGKDKLLNRGWLLIKNGYAHCLDEQRVGMLVSGKG